MTLRETLEYDKENGSIILANAIALKSSYKVGEISTYASICGGWVAGVHQWMDHNVESIDECENHKYVGFTAFFNDREVVKKFIIPVKMMDYDVKDWNHAKNLFNKFLRII